MKHLMTFENFVTENNTNVNEWLGQKFITGHGPGEKEEAIKRIEQEINTEIEKYKKNPQAYAPFNPELLKDKLLKTAKENGYRGRVTVRKSAGDAKVDGAGKLFIVYDPKASSLQDVGSAAASGTRVLGNF